MNARRRIARGADAKVADATDREARRGEVALGKGNVRQRQLKIARIFNLLRFERFRVERGHRDRHILQALRLALRGHDDRCAGTRRPGGIVIHLSLRRHCDTSGKRGRDQQIDFFHGILSQSLSPVFRLIAFTAAWAARFLSRKVQRTRSFFAFGNAKTLPGKIFCRSNPVPPTDYCTTANLPESLRQRKAPYRSRVCPDRCTTATHPEPSASPLLRHHRPAMSAAAFSAIMIVGALVLPPIRVGITDASTTRRPSIPRTCNSPSRGAASSAPIRMVPTGW